MREQDRKNLYRGWPFYAFCLVLMGILFIVYYRNPDKRKSEFLDNSIANYLSESKKHYINLDDVINDRETWEPILADWQDKPLPDLLFTDLDGKSRKLSEFSDQPLIIVIFSSWYPPCKMQMKTLENYLASAGSEQDIQIIALTAESMGRLQEYTSQKNSKILYGTVDNLPQPLSLTEEAPSLFFLFPPNELVLAVSGLVPNKHLEAIITLGIN